MGKSLVFHFRTAIEPMLCQYVGTLPSLVLHFLCVSGSLRRRPSATLGDGHTSSPSRTASAVGGFQRTADCLAHGIGSQTVCRLPYARESDSCSRRPTLHAVGSVTDYRSRRILSAIKLCEVL